MTQYKYSVIGDESEILFRAITLDEASRFINGFKQTNDPFAEEYIFELITDNKYNVDTLDAGIIPTVIFLAFSLSGVFKEQIDIPNKIDLARETLDGNAYYMMYAAIIRSQPSFTLDTLKQKTTNEVLELFAFAEIILGVKQVDTDKARESIVPDSTKSTAKGIKAITKEEIANLQETLGMMEFDGVLQDEYRF
jgi:hypothetical protein